MFRFLNEENILIVRIFFSFEIVNLLKNSNFSLNVASAKSFEKMQGKDNANSQN